MSEWHGAEAPAAPPRRLRIGRDADRTRDVGGITVPRLDTVVVVPRGKEEDRLAVRGFDDPTDVRGDERPAGEHTEADRLEMAEERVVALDRHDGFPRRNAVAVVQRV